MPFYKNALIIAVLPLLIAAPWLVRNWMLLGNPIWPFLNFIFDGIQSKSYSHANIYNLVSPSLFITTYLGIFGVPDGNPNTLSFFSFPYSGFLTAIWLIATFIFTIPLIVGFFSSCKRLEIRGKGYFTKKFLALWILSYLALFFLYAVNVGFSVSRMILPAFPALAVFWAFGYDRLMESIGFKKIIRLLTIFIIVGFTSAIMVKVLLAANAWKMYEKDFSWVKSNTSPDAVFIANGQCVPYNIERASLYATNENLKKADYVWINQNFRLDRRSILDSDALRFINLKNYNAVYSNEGTGTIVYKTK